MTEPYLDTTRETPVLDRRYRGAATIKTHFTHRPTNPDCQGGYITLYYTNTSLWAECDQCGLKHDLAVHLLPPGIQASESSAAPSAAIIHDPHGVYGEPGSPPLRFARDLAIFAALNAPEHRRPWQTRLLAVGEALLGWYRTIAALPDSEITPEEAALRDAMQGGEQGWQTAPVGDRSPEGRLLADQEPLMLPDEWYDTIAARTSILHSACDAEIRGVINIHSSGDQVWAECSLCGLKHSLDDHLMPTALSAGRHLADAPPPKQLVLSVAPTLPPEFLQILQELATRRAGLVPPAGLLTSESIDWMLERTRQRQARDIGDAAGLINLCFDQISDLVIVAETLLRGPVPADPSLDGRQPADLNAP